LGHFMSAPHKCMKSL